MIAKTGARIGTYILAAALALLVAPAGQAFGATVIDDFTTSQEFTKSDTGAPNPASDTVTDSMLGGSRTAVLNYVSGALNIKWDISTGLANFAVDPATVGSGDLIWDSGPFDLSGDDSFLFDYMICDQTVDVTLTVTGGGTDTHTFPLVMGIEQTNVVVPFSNFAGVDFSNLTEIRLSVPTKTAGLNPDCLFGPIESTGVEFECTKNINQYFVNPGDVVTATVTVNSVGASSTALVDVTDTLPDNLTSHACPPPNPGCASSACAGNQLIWTDCPVDDATPLVIGYSMDIGAIPAGVTRCNSVEVGDGLTSCSDCVHGPIPPPPEITRVPTLSEWGMILFMFLAGIIAIYHLRRHHHGK